MSCEIADGDRGQSVGDVVLAEQRQDEIRVAPPMVHGERAASKPEILNLLRFERRPAT